MADQHSELELAQRYASGALSPDDAAAFENHLVTCEQCQAEVRFAAGVRRLARDVQEHAKESIVSTRRIVAAAVLLAAGFAAFMFWPRGVDPQLAALGRVADPPTYQGMSVRNQRSLGDSLFDTAMKSYLRRNYDDAATGLRAALASGVDTIPATFFLASANLMAGHPRESADEFARLIAVGPNAAAYLPEAHYYRARALIQLGLGADALKELSAVSRDSDRAAAAAALADSVTQVLRR